MPPGCTAYWQVVQTTTPYCGRYGRSSPGESGCLEVSIAGGIPLTFKSLSRDGGLVEIEALALDEAIHVAAESRSR